MRSDLTPIQLPLLLDPLIGTQGCYLYTDSVATMLGVKYGTSPVMIRFSIPLPTGLPPATLHLQHLGFDSVPGGLSTSNGVTIRIMD